MKWRKRKKKKNHEERTESRLVHERLAVTPCFYPRTRRAPFIHYAGFSLSRWPRIDDVPCIYVCIKREKEREEYSSASILPGLAVNWRRNILTSVSRLNTGDYSRKRSNIYRYFFYHKFVRGIEFDIRVREIFRHMSLSRWCFVERKAPENTSKAKSEKKRIIKG